MRPVARLTLFFAVAAFAVGAVLELAGMEGRAAALSVATVGLTLVCVLSVAGARADAASAEDADSAV